MSTMLVVAALGSALAAGDIELGSLLPLEETGIVHFAQWDDDDYEPPPPRYRRPPPGGGYGGRQRYGEEYYSQPPTRQGQAYGQPRYGGPYGGPPPGYGRPPVYGGLPQRPMTKEQVRAWNRRNGF